MKILWKCNEKMSRNVTFWLYIGVLKYKSQKCHNIMPVTKICYENVTKCYEKMPRKRHEM